MMSLDGKLLDGIRSISINRKRVLYSTVFMARSSELVRMDLSTKDNLVTSVTFEHRKKGANSASLNIEKTIKGSNAILVCLYDFDKTGFTSWTTEPLVLEELNETKQRTRLMLDLVLTKLSTDKDNDYFWQYMVTFYETYERPYTNLTIPTTKGATS